MVEDVADSSRDIRFSEFIFWFGFGFLIGTDFGLVSVNGTKKQNWSWLTAKVIRCGCNIHEY